jgi:hypothetical protein
MFLDFELKDGAASPRAPHFIGGLETYINNLPAPQRMDFLRKAKI